MAAARLPQPGSDNDVWGDVLNEFLRVEHQENGLLKRLPQITGAQQKSEKGQVNGYAPLNSSGKVPDANLPYTFPNDGMAFEVFLDLNYTVNPATLTPSALGIGTNTHVLMRWVSAGTRGIYRAMANDTFALTTPIFNGEYNGALIWAYETKNGASDEPDGPYLYGVYTTEFCSLVTLAGPQASQQLTASQIEFNNFVPGQGASYVTTSGVTGDFSGTPATFDVEVDGNPAVTVTLNQNYGDATDVAAAIQQVVTLGVVSAGGGSGDYIYIRSPYTGGWTSVIVSNANAEAVSRGFANAVAGGTDPVPIIAGLDPQTVQNALVVIYQQLLSKVDTSDPRLQNMTAQSTSVDYTLTLTNAQGVVECFNFLPITVTIPTVDDVALPIGTRIEVVQMGAGNVAVAAHPNVTLRPGPVTISGQYRSVFLRQRAIDEWVITGNYV